jgi:hypothetical protein
VLVVVSAARIGEPIWAECTPDELVECQRHETLLNLAFAIQAPMAGRERPAVDRDGGRGLWMANQLCDLVQLRTFATGAVVRLHLYLR